MEFRKIYVRRLLPVLGIILVLVLTLIGHEALKAQAQVADTKEELRQIKNDNNGLDEDILKAELSDEVKAAVEAIFNDKLQTLNLADYFSEDDWKLISERIEQNILNGEINGYDSSKLSEEQKAIVDSLISDALSLYSQMNMTASLNDTAKSEVSALIDEAIQREIEEMYKKVGQDMSDMKNELVMTDEEKAELVDEISKEVLHDVLAYVTEHIQILYDGENGEIERELVCEKEEHVHDDECYKRELVCELEEDEDHSHTDECYEYELICEKEEHVHDDDCYENKEGGGGSSGSSPCVHVHVDYLLTDEDRSEIVADILAGTDLAGVLSGVFYEEIEKTMTDIVKDKMYEAILESLSQRLDEIIAESLSGIEDRLSEAENSVSEMKNELNLLAGDIEGLERGTQTIRFNDVTGMIECYSGGTWKNFMSASSIWVSKGLIYSAGKKDENFSGFKGFAIASPTISYTETSSALQFMGANSYSPGVSAQNIYTTDQTKPFEFMAEYNTLRIDYGIVATNTYVSHHKSNGSYEKCYYYNIPSFTIEVIDYTTKNVYSSRSATTSSSSLTQGVMELPLPSNPYYIKAYFYYGLSGTSQGEASGKGTSSAAYIYSMQCVKK